MAYRTYCSNTNIYKVKNDTYITSNLNVFFYIYRSLVVGSIGQRYPAVDQREEALFFKFTFYSHKFISFEHACGWWKF